MSVYEDVAALQQDMTAAQADIAALESAVTTAGTNITALQTAATAAAANITTAQGDITDLESGLTTAQGDISDLESGLTTAQTDITALETAAETASENITAAQEDITALEAATADSGWIDVTLASGWTNPYVADKAQYRKVGNIVYMRGLINATPAAGTLITTLPTGYRPTTFFSRYACSHAQSDYVNVNIKSDGTVTDYTKGTNGREFISLYGISFFIN